MVNNNIVFISLPSHASFHNMSLVVFFFLLHAYKASILEDLWRLYNCFIKDCSCIGDAYRHEGMCPFYWDFGLPDKGCPLILLWKSKILCTNRSSCWVVSYCSISYWSFCVHAEIPKSIHYQYKMASGGRNNYD